MVRWKISKVVLLIQFLAKNDRYDVETTAQQSINSKIMVKGSYLEFYG